MHRKISILSTQHPFEQVIFNVLCLLLMAAIGAYLYLVGASVIHVMARTEAQARSLRIESAIAKLEQTFFALSEGITPTASRELGLSPVRGTAYVYRPGNATALNTVRDSEI